ncbi:MAG: B12-binding domain-containing radical SAM protein [Deltaproteobacteria bacterium]|nr:B12-binding domain-containing radical SAM protein [Deltaproteobacteria bacterium]
MAPTRRSLHIALVEAPIKEPRRPSLALGYLAAILRGEGHSVAIHDINARLYHAGPGETRDLWEHFSHWVMERPENTAAFMRDNRSVIDPLLAAIAQDDPDIIGLSVLLTQRPLSIAVANALRAIAPRAVIVFGGPECFPMFNPAGFAESGGPGYAVIGEGEETIREFARRLAAGDDPLCPGVMRIAGGTAISGGPRAMIRSLDEIPFPDWEGFPLDLYREPGRFSIMMTRGCVNRCVFCMEPEMWSRFRIRSPGHVAAEIAHLAARHGTTSVEFNDSVINGSPQHLVDLCNLLVTRGPKVSWGAQAVVARTLDDRLCARLKAAGCGCLSFGVESGSDAVLALMGKRFTVTEASAALRACAGAGIATSVNIMCGFPGEMEDDFALTLSFLERNRAAITWVNPADAFTGIVPGTRLHREHERFGVRFVGSLTFWETVDGTNTFLVRMERFERLLRHLRALGLDALYPGLEYQNRAAWIDAFYRNREAAAR